MSGWLVAIAVVVASLGTVVALALVRKIADRFGSDDPSLVRAVLWFLAAVAGVIGISFLGNVWLAGAVVVVLSVWSLVGAALDARGAPARQRAAMLQLYAVLFGASYAHASSRGMLTGLGASTSLSFALNDQLGQFALPLAEKLTAFSTRADPTFAIALVAQGLGRHFVLVLALSTFAFASYAAAYFSTRPLALPGVELLPFPRVATLVFVGVVGVHAFLPPTRMPGLVLGLVTISLTPLFVADGGALIHRWLSRFRTRGLILVFCLGASLLLPALLVLFAVFGVLAQLLGLRELLPFAALDEMPLKRPRLSSLLVSLTVAAVIMGATTLLAQRSLSRASPRLGVGTHVCGATEAVVDWKARSVSFEVAGARFSMDLDETPLSRAPRRATDPAQVCEVSGKRLCTSDEWYLACACTYPLEVETGTKRSTLYALVARAERERLAPALGREEPSVAADKRSELRSLITGRSEIVAGGNSSSILLAGPNDLTRDPWTVDCRYRARVTPQALEQPMTDVAAVRCCR